MCDVGAPHRLIALMERFARKLKRLADVEFPQCRAPDRRLYAVAIVVGEDGIVRRDGLLDGMNRGVPAVARRPDLRIRLDRNLDKLRDGERGVGGAEWSGIKCRDRER